jgi:mono/diheme cytochrome c family protein
LLSFTPSLSRSPLSLLLWRSTFLLCFGGAFLPLAAADEGASPDAAAPRGRVSRDLRALYTFETGSGDSVLDQSGVGTPLDLTIDPPAAVEWQTGSLRVKSGATIRSARAATKITTAVKRSGELTIEAWVRPANVEQKGPARIVSLSRDPSERNFTLGQAESQYDVRMRTTKMDRNGNPSLATPSGTVRGETAHVVYTLDRERRAKIWVDAREVTEKQLEGDVSAWNDDFRFVLANEFSGDRPWLGELWLVAIYSRALEANEIAQNFAAGREATAPPTPFTRRLIAERASADPSTANGDAGVALPADSSAQDPAAHFASRIAPLLRQHCIECHGSTTPVKGRLDLSRRDTAFTGGRSGVAILPGNAAESLLWQSVESDEMPKKRPALSAGEKALLRAWIDAGAHWSVDVVASPLHHDATIPRHREFACPEEEALRHDPGPALDRRLSVREYVETVRATLGVDISREAREILPKDLRADGYSNTAYNLGVDLEHIEGFTRLAQLIVERLDILALAARHTSCADLTEACFVELASKLGRRLLRGPLGDDDLYSLSRIALAVADENGDFAEAVGFLVEALLQSPRFLYRIENRSGDGTPRLVDPFALASRLSYAIVGSSPDDELFDAAASGKLSNREEVAAHVDRLLGDPRAVGQSLHFASEWLHLDRLEFLRPSPPRFSAWDPRLAADMRAETLAFFEELVWRRKRPLHELFNAQFTMLTPRLARHYGLEVLPPKGDGDAGALASSEDAPVLYDLSSVPSRGGLLTHGSVLTIGGDEASMVARGLFVLRDLLSSGVDAPPPGTDTTPVPPEPGRSNRDVAEVRLQNSACGGCHARFEPLSFGLEKFDGIGAFREKDEHGNALREDGEILLPGVEAPIRYQTAAELMELLSASERVREGLSLELTQFVLGRPLVASDACHLREIHAAASKGGGTYTSLIRAILTSDLVLTTRTEPIP